MKKHLLFSIVTIVLLLISNTNYSQTVNLGILESFEAYTGAGDVGIGGTATGDVGTNLGAISGTYSGTAYTADATTAQARFDLLRLYIHLNSKFVDFPNAFSPIANPAHAATFGGETLAPGVYYIGSAGGITGALTLDGKGDPNALFVIKMGGAMTTGAGSIVTLTGGAKSSNVFWIIDGAITVAAGCKIIGTLFSKGGAIVIGASSTLDGRMLTLAGAITTAAGSSTTLPPEPSTIPISCDNNCAPAPAANILGVLSGFALFSSNGNVTNTAISGVNGIVGTNAGTITGYKAGTHIGTEEIANALTIQAAADLDTAYNTIMDMPASKSHAADFTNETVLPGVYHIATAGSFTGTIILDGGGNPDAIFVFTFTGACNITAGAKTILTNGTRRCNVFFLAGAGMPTGALNIGAGCEVQGTFISHGGACNSGIGTFLAGRQLSTLGAVNTSTCVIYNNPECVTSKSLSIAAIAAVTDSPSALAGTNTASVIINDTVSGEPAVIGTAAGQVTLTFTNSGPLSMNPDGTITVASNTTVGSYTITYTICEVSKPTSCSTVTSTVTVTAPAIVAVVDTPSVLAGTNTASVILNDKVNGVQAVIGTAPGDVTLTASPNGPLTMNTDGTIAVAANTPAGAYTITYTICEVNNPTNCSTPTTITVTVTAPAIVAVVDTPSVLPGTNTASVILNDKVNGVQAVIGTAPGQVTLTSTPNGPLTMNTDGTIAVAANTPAGDYTITYTICEVNNPTNCSTLITVTVTVNAIAIAAVNDSYNLDCATTSTLGNVLTNDTLDTKSITSSDVIITLESGANANISLNTTGDLSITNNLAYGEYTLGYKICQATNTTNCSSGTITISLVQPLMPSIVNCSDTFTFTNCVWVQDNNIPIIR